MMQKNKNKTVVECYITGCKYNSACCLSPHDFADIKCYCQREHITIDISEEDDYNFACTFFTSGHKDRKCAECERKEHNGEIILGDDIFEVEEFIDDDEFLE